MLSFLAMIFTLRLGLGASPVEGVKVSLREEALAIAVEQAVEREAAEVATVRAPALGWSAPPKAHQLTKEEWQNLLTKALSNETIANAAMWIATQPVHVSVTGQKFFVSVRISTP